MKTTLNKLDLNISGIIEEIQCSDIIRTRLLDLGIIKGTVVTPVLKSVFNDPTAYNIRGSILAIRAEDSKKIIVFLK